MQRARSEPLLLLCWYDPSGISTVPETVRFMQRFSRFPVTLLNLFEYHEGGPVVLDAALNLDAFAGIVIHNSLSYNVDNLRSLDRDTRRKLKDYAGTKILMKQDENYRFREVAAFIGATGFDVVFTCLAEKDIPAIYPREVVGMPQFERMLTGYVTPGLRALDWQNADRPVDIAYRGSVQPLDFGRLAYEKRSIGEDVARALAGRGLKLDISSRWKDRFGGAAWFDFLCSAKATLGTESGASIFDLDGDLAARCAAVVAELGLLRDEPAYAEAYLARLADLEDRIDYRQVSPRHFEAAAAGTLQLLYPGDYSGIFQPNRHYFPLARDLSNLDEAIALLRDEPRRRDMVATAHREIIANETYWIETFIARFDAATEYSLQSKGRLAPAGVTPVGNTPPDMFFADRKGFSWRLWLRRTWLRLPAFARTALLPVARRFLAY